MSQDEEKALLALPAAPPERQERYGPHPSQVVDLYGEGASGGRVVLLHGGFWREQWDRSHLSPFAAALAGQGIPVALVEYRRVGGGGGWPATAEDVGAALDLLGAPPSVLFGHSAGGHLALWAAAARERAAGRVVVAAPVADLERAHATRLNGGVVSDFLGGEERVAAALAEADPMRLLPPHAGGDPARHRRPGGAHRAVPPLRQQLGRPAAPAARRGPLRAHHPAHPGLRRARQVAALAPGPPPVRIRGTSTASAAGTRPPPAAPASGPARGAGPEQAGARGAPC